MARVRNYAEEYARRDARARVDGFDSYRAKRVFLKERRRKLRLCAIAVRECTDFEELKEIVRKIESGEWEG